MTANSRIKLLFQEIIDQEVESILSEMLSEQPSEEPEPTDPMSTPGAGLEGAGTTAPPPVEGGEDATVGGEAPDLTDGGEAGEGESLDLDGDGAAIPGEEGSEEGEDAGGMDLGGGGGLSIGGGGGGGDFGGGDDMDLGGDDEGEDDSGDDGEGGDEPESTGDPVEDTFNEAEKVAKDTQNPQKVLNAIKFAIQNSDLETIDQMKELTDKLADSDNPVLKDTSRRLRIFINT